MSSNTLTCASLKNKITQEGIELGRELFYDSILSENYSISCNTCHKQEFAFSDGLTSNPLNKILFYNNKTNEVITNNKVKNFSLLLNQNHQEYVFRVYCIDLTKLNLFYQFFKNI